MGELHHLSARRKHASSETGDAEDARTIALREQLERLAAENGDVEAKGRVVSIEPARLRRLVRRLPRKEREVIVLRYGLRGLRLTLEEAAARLDIGLTTVFDIEQRALTRLRGFYEELAATA